MNNALGRPWAIGPTDPDWHSAEITAKILGMESMPGEQCGWTMHSFVPRPGLIGAVVVQGFVHECASMPGP